MNDTSCWQIIEPESYYKSFIDKNERPDGRGFLSARPVNVRTGSISTAEGSATVKFGSTTVVCGIKAEICPPTLKKPTHGFIVPNVELYPCASPKFKPGPPGPKSIGLSQFLHSLLVEESVVELKELCIKESKFVWCLYVDLICLDYDGNLSDACVMALVAALTDLKLPDVIYDEESEKISLTDSSHTLALKDRPLSVTFGVYDTDITLLDCTALDERECRGELTVILSQDGALVSTRKSGEKKIAVSKMQPLILKATERAEELRKVMEKGINSC